MRTRPAKTDSGWASRRTAGRRSLARRPDGMSLVEVMIAATLLLIIVVGTLPLFIHAMKSNIAGREATVVSNQARSRTEEYLQFPFNSAELTLTAGTEKVISDYFSEGDGEWKVGSPPVDDPALWLRTTTIRQYGMTMDAAGNTDLTAALDATAPAATVQLKEIEVKVNSGVSSGGTFGPPKSITVRVWRAF